MNATFTLTTILNATCDYYQITLDEIKSKSRKSHLNKARKMFYYIANEFSLATHQEKANIIITHKQNVHDHIQDVRLKKDLYSDIKKDIQGIVKILFTEKTIIVTDINLLKITENYSNRFK